jgi:hypothetical protein
VVKLPVDVSVMTKVCPGTSLRLLPSDAHDGQARSQSGADMSATCHNTYQQTAFEQWSVVTGQPRLLRTTHAVFTTFDAIIIAVGNVSSQSINFTIRLCDCVYYQQDALEFQMNTQFMFGAGVPLEHLGSW